MLPPLERQNLIFSRVCSPAPFLQFMVIKAVCCIHWHFIDLKGASHWNGSFSYSATYKVGEKKTEGRDMMCKQDWQSEINPSQPCAI